MQDTTNTRRPGRPRTYGERRRTTIMLQASLLDAIDANLGEVASDRSRNAWIETALAAYLHRDENAASQAAWRELRAMLTAEIEKAEQELHAVRDALAHPGPAQATSPQWRERMQRQAHIGEGTTTALRMVRAWMDTLEQWTDAAAHPAAHQE